MWIGPRCIADALWVKAQWYIEGWIRDLVIRCQLRQLLSSVEPAGLGVGEPHGPPALMDPRYSRVTTWSGCQGVGIGGPGRSWGPFDRAPPSFRISTAPLLAYTRCHPPRQAGRPIWRLAVHSRERGRRQEGAGRWQKRQGDRIGSRTVNCGANAPRCQGERDPLQSLLRSSRRLVDPDPAGLDDP